ncbi:ESX secretion-associated protein EspG [Nocardia donostiensis]|uniref:ESX secretion-associated protein EspG n=1 Tax=Nocardia donostiensis TaxID=1538463 RepID=UPI0009DAC7FA|nr:ESX secretion-associated protein EspG [Nocardia donostiensis]OQS12818.1 ESX secretion-associated protein EspG [Nocardia donostiensis]
MNGKRWQLDGLAFTIALEAIGRDRLPYPLSYMPEYTEHRADYERLRQHTAQRLQQVFDERFYNALTVLLEPTTRVEIEGFYGPNQTQVVRIHAGIVGDRATLANQQPGPTSEHGRDIIITEHPTRMLAAEIIARLPRTPAGTHHPFRARRSDLNAPIYSHHPTRLSPQEDMQRFLRRPRGGTGEITVYPGYTLDARPTNNGRAFLWLDYPHDGRYLLHHHNTDDFTITPGPPDELMRQLQDRIDAVGNRRTTAW